MPDYKVGQTATNSKGEKVRFDGNSWVRAGATAPAGGKKLSVQAQNFLNQLSTEAASAGETGRIYERSRNSIKTMRTSPNRGRLMEMATPEEGGGILDTLGSYLIGAPLRAVGAITEDETNAFQQLRGLQSQNVLEKQLQQKGPQTESDAARLQLTEISPSKSAKVNNDVIESGMQKVRRTQAKATFFTQWADKWGLNGVSPHGYTKEQIWAKMGDQITNQLLGSSKPAPKADIKIISRTKVR